MTFVKPASNCQYRNRYVFNYTILLTLTDIYAYFYCNTRHFSQNSIQTCRSRAA